NVSGTGITVSNVAVSSPSSLTARFTLGPGSAVGTYSVTVTTANGTSGPVQFSVFGAPPPTITSIAPISGARGTTVNVTITGTGFATGASVSVSGTGVTVGNVNVVSSTTITARFVISSTAATGGHTVAVTLNGVTTNGVTFTIN